MAFWGIFTGANVDPFMVVGTHCFKCSSYHSTGIQQMCNIVVMFGRIIYIFRMEPLVDSDRKGSI